MCIRDRIINVSNLLSSLQNFCCKAIQNEKSRDLNYLSFMLWNITFTSYVKQLYSSKTVQYLYHSQKVSFLTRFPTEECQNCKRHIWLSLVSWHLQKPQVPCKQQFHVVCQWLSVWQPVASILPGQNHISRKHYVYLYWLISSSLIIQKQGNNRQTKAC